MITFVVPLAIYLLSFPVMLVTLFRVEVGILFFALIVPIISLVQKLNAFPQGNNFGDFLLVSMVVGWILGSLRKGRKIFVSSPVNLVVILVMLNSLINLIRGYTFIASPEETNLIRLMAWKNYMILPVLYFISINNVEKEKLLWLIIICISFTLLAMDFNFYSTFRWIRAEHYRHSIRISGPFGFLGPNELGIFYSMYTFLLLGISYFIENKRIKYFVLFVCACNIYPIMYSFSRAAYMCTLTGLLIIGILKDKKFIALLIVLVLLYGFILPRAVVERIDNTFLEEGNISEEEARSSAFEVGDVTIEVTGRKVLWEKAINYFETEPILGIGFDSFREIEGWITHSLFMRILAEQGLVGMTVFVIFTITILIQAYRLFRNSPSKLGQGIGLGFFTCIIVHLVGSTVGDQTLYYNMMAIYWFFIGIVARLNSNLIKGRGRDNSDREKHYTSDTKT